MERGLEFLGFALSATVFSAVFLVGIIVYGGEFSRAVALVAAFLAAASQFVGQDRQHWRISVLLAYAAFALGLFGLFAMIGGR
ncbi:hypothetical protein [Brucella sp. IR073]|uniref:hypothetical protein n=1 Tax=unclassified Brucella TaxID=2632610 RepID=UPI003B97FA4F